MTPRDHALLAQWQERRHLPPEQRLLEAGEHPVMTHEYARRPVGSWWTWVAVIIGVPDVYGVGLTEHEAISNLTPQLEAA